jgi:hypothetical protein
MTKKKVCKPRGTRKKCQHVSVWFDRTISLLKDGAMGMAQRCVVCGKEVRVPKIKTDKPNPGSPEEKDKRIEELEAQAEAEFQRAEANIVNKRWFRERITELEAAGEGLREICHPMTDDEFEALAVWHRAMGRKA